MSLIQDQKPKVANSNSVTKKTTGSPALVKIPFPAFLAGLPIWPADAGEENFVVPDFLASIEREMLSRQPTAAIALSIAPGQPKGRKGDRIFDVRVIRKTMIGYDIDVLDAQCYFGFTTDGVDNVVELLAIEEDCKLLAAELALIAQRI